MGFDVSEQIGSLPAVLNAAIAGNMGLGDSANIVTNIMSAFGLTAEDSGKAVDVLAKAANSANTDIPLMGEAFKMVAPIASSLGWSIEETAAAIGELGNVGIAGSQAGTVLRQALLSLNDPVGQTEKAMEKLGIEVLNAEGNMKPMPELMGHIASKLDGMTDAQKTQAASQLVGSTAAAGFISLLEVGEEGLQDFTTELENSEGAAQKMADVQSDTLTGSFKEFQSAMEEAGIKLGQEFLPLFTDIVRKGTDVVSAFDEVNVGQLKSALAFGGTAAAIALTISTVGKLVIALRGLMASMGPAGWLTLGLSVVGGLIAGVNVGMNESSKINLEHAKSLIEQQHSLDDTITRFESLQEKNKLSNDEMSEFVDLQSQISRETNAEVLEELQKKYDKLQEKSGLSNSEMADFLALNDDLIDIVPESNVRLTEQGNILVNNTDAAQDMNKELLRMIDLELDAQRAQLDANLSNYINEYTNALEDANKAIEDRNQGIIDLAGMEHRRGELEKERLDYEKEGNEDMVELYDELLSQSNRSITAQQMKNSEIAKEVLERAKSVDAADEELKKANEIYHELVEVELQHVGINAAKGEGLDALDKEIEKLNDAKKELEENTSEADKKKEKYKDGLAAIEDNIDALETSRQKIEGIYDEQAEVNSKINEGTEVAGTLNEVLRADQIKNLEFTGDGMQKAQLIHSSLGEPVTKNVSIRESISRVISSISGVSTRSHQGGFAGEGEPIPSISKHHAGDLLNEAAINKNQLIQGMVTQPLHNEIDVRLLRNEMVLTEGQQANLWRMIESNSQGRGSSSTDDRVVSLLQELVQLTESGRITTLTMKERVVADILEPLITETQNRDKYTNNAFRRRR